MADGSHQVGYLDAVEAKDLSAVCAALPRTRFDRRSEKLERESPALRLNAAQLQEKVSCLAG